MARILMVASVALIAMSLWSVAYAQTVTESPTITASHVVIPSMGEGVSEPPLPQLSISARGNAAATYDTSAQQQNVAQTETENSYEAVSEKKKKKRHDNADGN